MNRTSAVGALAMAVFRRPKTFCFMLALPILLWAGLVLPKAPLFESTASLMVRVVDHEMAVPDRISEQEGQSATSSANMAKQIINSELVIIASPDVLKSAITRTGLLRTYPSAIEKAKKKGLDPLELAAASLVKEHLTVQVNGDTNVIMLSTFHPDPAIAQALLGNLIGATISKQATVMRGPRLQFLEKKLSAMRSEADRAHAALLEFKQRTKITAFDDERALLLRQRDALELGLHEMRTDFVAALGRSGALAETLRTTPESIALSDENDRAQRQVDEARARLVGAQARYDVASQRFTAANPELMDLAQQLEAAKRDVAEATSQSMERVRMGANPVSQGISGALSTARSDASAHRQAVTERQGQLQEVNARIEYLDDNELTLRDLERRRELTIAEYNSYLERAQSARILNDMNEAGITNLRVIQSPTLPYQATRPRKVLLGVLAFAAGLLLAFALCLVLERRDPTFVSPYQLEDRLGLPVLAAIPLKRSEAT